MYSNTVRRNADLVTYVDGVEASRVSVTVYNNAFSVLNGLVQGDGVRPNPIYFKSVKTFGSSHLIHNEDYIAGRRSTMEILGTYYVSPSFIPSLNVDWARTQDRALEKCFDKLRGETSNLVVDFAEGKQTWQMIRNMLRVRTVFADFVKNMCRSQRYQKITNGQKRLDYVTGKWLEYRYGWMPLVRSIYDGLDTYGKDVSRGEISVKGRSGATAVAVLEYGDSNSISTPRARVVRHLAWRTEYELDFYLKPGHQIEDWTSLNPLAIAWELTPLSFVADWFVNVAQQISLMENHWLYGSAFRGGYRTNGYKDTISLSRSGSRTEHVAGLSLFSFVEDGGVKITTEKERVILLSLPYPSLNLRFGSSWTTKHLLDTAALTQVFFGRKSRGIRN